MAQSALREPEGRGRGAAPAAKEYGVNTRVLHYAVLLSVAALLLVTNIDGYDLWPPDEPRFAEVAREMIQSGDFLVPRVNGEPYLEKPPLLFWAIAAASAPFGEVTSVSARLPSIIAALIALLCTYRLASRLMGARVGLWSAIVLMTNVRFAWQGRMGQIDMLLTACLSAAFLAFWRWHETPRRRWLFTFYAAIAMAVYAKGPVGILLPLMLAIAFYWHKRDRRRRLHLFWGMLGIAVAIGAWLIPARMAAATDLGATAGSLVAGNLFRQTVGRFFLGVSHA
ncbi:MAG TPA: glycosyltransferase family 39 protein, partial [Candidatus Hydrogenedentes bacterium]|nr:glycosyltransferase family 39 protein [Candidatus Hydrogenedentota bacterium]